jgi:hypothetical protein
MRLKPLRRRHGQPGCLHSVQVRARAVGSVVRGLAVEGARLWSSVSSLENRLAGAEALKRFECCRLVGQVVECPCCCLDLGDRGLAQLEAEAREPAQRRALEPLRLGGPDDDADRERVSEVDMRQLTSRVSNERDVAALMARWKRAYADP